MKKKSLILLVVGLLTITLISIYATMTPAQINKQIDHGINVMMEQIANVNDPKIEMSSNPYDYAKNNAGLEQIVNQGSKAIPILKDKIASSSENGLKEYLLAIAIEKITKIDLKGDNFGWSDAKGFTKVFDEHLKSIPGKVNSIANSSDRDKVEKLIKLGTPAIPFIMDEIEKGNDNIIPALIPLLEGNKEVEINKDSLDRNWVINNKSKFADLRKLVNDAQ